MKKVLASLLLMLQIIFLIPMQAVAEETTTIIVHYKEVEGNQMDWNLWIWPAGGEGSVHDFTEEDNFGKVATIELSGKHDSVGFIVRTDAWEKDVSADRFIDQFDGGVAEIWILGGQEAFYYENPNGSEGIVDESIDLTVHFNNYDGDYNDVQVEAYVNEDKKLPIDMTEEDFGIKGQIIVDETLNQSEILISITDRSQQAVYSVKKIKEGKAEVFLVQNNDRVFYTMDDAVYTPAITDAKLMDANIIVLDANMPFKATLEEIEVFVNDEVVSLSDMTYEPFSDEFISPKAVVLELSDSVLYSDEIQIKLPKFELTKVQLGDVYDTKAFNETYNYDGVLGPIYTSDGTTFKVWAPTAQDVNLAFFDDHKSDATESFDMIMSDQGVWEVTVDGDLHNQLFAYEVKHINDYEYVVDPYAKGVSVNGILSAVIDLERTNPEGWPADYKTDFSAITDAVMYEIHVRDLSMHGESGIENKGLFLGFTEKNTKTKNGFSTGLDYIKDLGVTHIQFMPIYDYGSINEAKNDYDFNWGYDPVNYNALEGSYSSDPFTPDVRIYEFKKAVQSIHDADMKVTMDVVYNHVYSVNAMAFEKLVPGYYFRKEGDNFANGSGCGNETASERYMMRKFMVDSVSYLAKEYHLDGFRFDLMGLHDVETMNQIRDALDESITIIGEGWNMGNVLPEGDKANQNQAHLMPGIAHFNDTIRDGLKGSVFDGLDQGFVSGKENMANTVFSGIVGGVKFEELSTWGDVEPSQVVTYVEAHDNNTLYDKLKISNPDATPAEIEKMHVLADSIILTSQGVPFIHAGQEFMRTKLGDENSYKSSDIVNRLDWTRREKYDDLVTYFKTLIEMRKNHQAFRMATADDIRENLHRMNVGGNVIAYAINDPEDSWDSIVVIHNAEHEPVELKLPESAKWHVVVENGKANLETLRVVEGDTISVSDISTTILYKAGELEVTEKEETKNHSLYLWIAGIVIVLGAGILWIRKRK